MYACSQNCHTIQVLGISVMNWNILTTLMVLTIKHSSDHCQAKIYIGHPTLLPLAFCPPWNACVKIIVRYCQNSRRQNNPSRNISGNAICIPVLQRYAHNMSSSCRTCSKEIWAAFFRQTIWAGLEWFLAASPTATVQVNTEKVKPNILSLIFCSWNSI